MSKTFQIDIITPTSITSISDASYLRVPSIDGLIGVQSKHANAIIALDIGEIKISDANGKNTYYATSGGFADIKPESTQLLLETIEQDQDIDKKRVEKSLERANKRMSDKEQDLNRLNSSLKRAKNRLHVISRLS